MKLHKKIFFLKRTYIIFTKQKFEDVALKASIMAEKLLERKEKSMEDKRTLDLFSLDGDNKLVDEKLNEIEIRKLSAPPLNFIEKSDSDMNDELKNKLGYLFTSNEWKNLSVKERLDRMNYTLDTLYGEKKGKKNRPNMLLKDNFNNLDLKILNSKEFNIIEKNDISIVSNENKKDPKREEEDKKLREMKKNLYDIKELLDEIKNSDENEKNEKNKLIDDKMENIKSDKNFQKLEEILIKDQKNALGYVEETPDDKQTKDSFIFLEKLKNEISFLKKEKEKKNENKTFFAASNHEDTKENEKDIASNHEIYQIKDTEPIDEETVWNKNFLKKIWKQIKGKNLNNINDFYKSVEYVGSKEEIIKIFQQIMKGFTEKEVESVLEKTILILSKQETHILSDSIKDVTISITETAKPLYYRFADLASLPDSKYTGVHLALEKLCII
jgi:hypothetical protein